MAGDIADDSQTIAEYTRTDACEMCFNLNILVNRRRVLLNKRGPLDKRESLDQTRPACYKWGPVLKCNGTERTEKARPHVFEMKAHPQVQWNGTERTEKVRPHVQQRTEKTGFFEMDARLYDGVDDVYEWAEKTRLLSRARTDGMDQLGIKGALVRRRL